VTLADAQGGRSNLQIDNGEPAFRSIAEGTREVFAKAGMDFADALHLASSERGCTFATFDRKLVKVASSIEGTPPTKLV